MTIETFDDDFDFGFTSVSEEDLKSSEKKLQAEVVSKSAELEKATQTYEEKLNALYKMVMPLLNNLAKDEKNEYIYWPDRGPKVKAFIKKVNKLMEKS